MKEYLICLKCGNITTEEDGKSCCGEDMVRLTPNSVDAAQEKHVPVVDINNEEVTVKVGEINHPMEEAHYIKWIYLVTNKGIKKEDLKPNMEPLARFKVEKNEEIKEALDYCNLHGLWIKEIVKVK